MIDRIHDGLFREDLYYFLNTLEIKVPSLKNRPEDIEPLVNHYLNEGKELSEQKSFSRSDEKAFSLSTARKCT